VLCGCKQETITTYSIPKEESKATAPGTPQMMPGLAQQTSGFTTPNWQPARHWETQDPGPMRKGRWNIARDNQKAEVTAAAFPGDVGGDLANVNRWLGQIGLSSIDAPTLEKQSLWVAIDGKTCRLLILYSDDTPQAIIAAIVPHQGSTWFFKLMGETALVLQEEAAFRAFLDSIHFDEA
tara:strand:+ start:17373 stop:17912 length:540 start_codon:yes stop_codon:yes gene_type:complete